MLSRRHMLALCSCALCAGAVSGRSAHANEADIDEAYFFCGTPQITDVYTHLQQFANHPGDPVTLSNESGAGDNGVVLDLYATAQRALKWTKAKADAEKDGHPLVRVAFVDGSEAQRQAVADVAQEWLKHNIGLAFEFVDDLAKSRIRVSFNAGYDHSKVGIEALSVGKTAATMWLPSVQSGASAKRIRRAVLHEFGHGLMTFGHEHRHPDAGFVFKPAETIRDLINANLPPGATPWTVGMVKTNITDPPYTKDRACTVYDVESIMHYPVASNWLVAGTSVPNPATALSALDIECALGVYA